MKEQFTLPELRKRLPAEKPGYVTRLVRQLQRDGHLRDEAGTYSWTCETDEFPADAWIRAQVHGTQLLQSPANDRPRERLLKHGANALRTAELLAILIRTGRKGESALQAGERIAARYNDELPRLRDAGRGELHEISSAVGDTAYCQIMAAVELGRRVAEALAEPKGRPRRITGSAEAIAFCRDHFARLASDAAREEFHVVSLDTQHAIVGSHQISVGSLDRSMVHPREAFRAAIKDAAKAVILVHNHPSGEPTPSKDDLLVTSRLEEAGEILGIQVLDHIIVARDGSVSIQDFRAARK